MTRLPLIIPSRNFGSIITNRYWLLIIFLLYPFTSISNPLNHKTASDVQVAIFLDGSRHRLHTTRSLSAFKTKHPDINLDALFFSTMESYTPEVKKWFHEHEGPDILFWMAGRRINMFSDKGLVHDLQDFWDKHNLEESFPSAISDTVKINGRVHAIPVTTFFWGIYYRKSFFKESNLTLPKTWEDTIHLCKTLRIRGIDLFSIGSKTAWVTHGWFDYFNLRVNGLTFHKRLLEGNISYTDKRVKSALRYWKQLIDNQCFNSNHKAYDHWQSFPRIVHGISALSLADGIPATIPLQSFDEYGLMEFPVIDPSIPRYTVTPVNVFLVPIYTELSQPVKRVLHYISGPKFQSEFNKEMTRLPAHNMAIFELNNLSTDEYKQVLSTPGGIQYFDRNTDINFAGQTPKIFVEFLDHADVDKVAQQLEQKRLEVFGEVAEQ